MPEPTGSRDATSSSPEPAPAASSRRDALRAALTALGGAALAGPPVAAAEPARPGSRTEAEPFVPENDYPYFGFEPDDATGLGVP